MKIDIRPAKDGRGEGVCEEKLQEYIVLRIEVQHKIIYKSSGQKEEKFLLVLA
jgi:hypothetical protein